MADDVDLGFAVRLPPRRAIEYLRDKGYDISWNWWETWEAAHARAFTVAKAVKLDVLSTIRNSLDEALAQGKTRRAFARELEPKLRQLGWWGKQIIVNERGEAQEVQLGSPRRLRTIYDTNMRTAYSAARYREQHDNAESRPYWMYDARNDERTRPSHAALDGKVFRHDDPIWDTHYPPNGWNCRCSVRALTKSQVEKRGLEVQASGDGLREVEQEVGTDKQTGEVIKRPGTAYDFDGPNGGRETLLPDPGWSYNPGKTGAAFGPVTGNPNRLDAIVGDANQKTWQTFGLPERLPEMPAPPRLPPASTREGARRQIYDALGEAGGQRISITRADGVRDTIFGRVATPNGLDDVMLTRGFVEHLTGEHAKRTREVFADLILPTLRDPTEVWLQPHLVDNRIVYRRAFIAAFEGRDAVAVVQEDRHGNLSWTFFPEDRINRRRVGYLLYRRPGPK